MEQREGASVGGIVGTKRSQGPGDVASRFERLCHWGFFSGFVSGKRACRWPSLREESRPWPCLATSSLSPHVVQELISCLLAVGYEIERHTLRQL